MPSSLIPEKPLVFSPALAATIGLEEAIMLQGLHEAMTYQSGTVEQAYRWYQFEQKALESRFPFWNAGDVQRIVNSLRDKGIVMLGAKNYLLDRTLHLALNEKVVTAVSKEASQVTETKASFHPPVAKPVADPVPTPRSATAAKGRHKMYAQWQADAEIIKQLKKLGIAESFIHECLPEFVHYWIERDEAHHGWSSKFRSWVTRCWREQETVFAAQQNASEMSQHWQPDTDAVDILLRAGVDKHFIEDAVPEFVLYWRERGDSTSTWNSKFVQHIRLQWARYTHAIDHDTEAKVIADNWQPSAELFEILQMANIDPVFARQLVPEFILYWRESGQLHKSWNSKFLQHVKYHWAKRHNYLNNKDSVGFIERHTDKSWRQGL